jgi:hypothetical protein
MKNREFEGEVTVRPGRLATEIVRGSGKGGRVVRPARALSRAPIGSALVAPGMPEMFTVEPRK